MTKDIDFINNVNLHGYEIRNVSIEKVAAVPTGVFPKGKILYATNTNPGFYYCDGEKWELITGETARKALENRLTDVETKLGISGGSGSGSTSLASRIDTLETTLMGSDKTGTKDGVKYQVGINTADISDIDTEIGSTEYAGNSITEAIATLQGKDTTQDNRLTALEGSVGNADSGLTKRVIALETGTLKTTDRVTTITGTSNTSVPSEKAVADYISTKLSGAYTFKSTVPTYDALPSGATAGDIYNVAAEFTYEGRKYAAGTNVVWDAESNRWEPLTGILDTSGFQLKSNIVTDTLELGQVDKYPSVSLVKSEIAKKANAGDVYTTEQINTELNKKVDKLSSHPTSSEGTTATFTKVTVNYQGQVTTGEAKITQADISGTIDTSKITSFDSNVRTASRQVIKNVTLSEAGTTVSHDLNIEYPQVAIYDGTLLVYAHVEYVGTSSIKIYGKSTNPTVTVVVSV